MEWYYYFYFKIYCFAKNISDDFLNDWKPLIIISVLECMTLEQAYVWYTVVTKKGVEISNFWLFLIALSIVSFNYFTFLHKEKWKAYNRKFNALSKTRRFWSGAVILLIMLAIVGDLVYAFYRMSLIDWKKYRS